MNMKRTLDGFDERRALLAERYPFFYSAPICQTAVDNNQLAHDERPDDKDNDESQRGGKKQTGYQRDMKYFRIDPLTTTYHQQLIKEYEILNHNRYIAFPSTEAAKENVVLYGQHGCLIGQKLDEIKEEKRKEETPILIALSKEGNPAGLELLTLTTAIWKLNMHSHEVLDEKIPQDNEALCYRTPLNDVLTMKATSLPTASCSTVIHW